MPLLLAISLFLNLSHASNSIELLEDRKTGKVLRADCEQFSDDGTRCQQIRFYNGKEDLSGQCPAPTEFI
ncbi:MAG: hypothetical protein AAB425_11965 [Bdellovibrionota bacterium]